MRDDGLGCRVELTSCGQIPDRFERSSSQDVLMDWTWGVREKERRVDDVDAFDLGESGSPLTGEAVGGAG